MFGFVGTRKTFFKTLFGITAQITATMADDCLGSQLLDHEVQLCCFITRKYSHDREMRGQV